MTSSALPTDLPARLDRARLALDGLSVGDALGETCFLPENWNALIEDPRRARAPWPYTDDTTMALAIFEVLGEFGRIDQDALAQRFAARYRAAPWRGYGAGAHRLLAQILGGSDWRVAAAAVFRGGSFGNGSAMRIAPLAAFFAEDGFEKVAAQAALASEVTHAHPEGIAGGIAVAVAGAYAWLNRNRRSTEAVKRALFDTVLTHTPAGEVCQGIDARRRSPSTCRLSPPCDYSTTECKEFRSTCPSRSLCVNSATAAASRVRTPSRSLCGLRHVTWTTTSRRSSRRSAPAATSTQTQQSLEVS